MNVSLLVEYNERITPGFLLFALVLWVLPRDRTELRIVLYILLFILVRDAMTPLGLWRIERAGKALVWLRFVEDPGLLLLLGASCVGLVFGTLAVEKDFKKYVLWRKGPWLQVIAFGFLTGAAVGLPGWILGRDTPLFLKGGAVPAGLLPVIFIFTILGNFYEEMLFRGFLQGYLETKTSEKRAMALSGLFFGAGHIFLSYTVTDVGAPLVIFTLYEGLLCAFLRTKYGVISSTLAHGFGIFLLGSGWV
ncbi:MAG: CPBP family intramembrane glutamic endopeptidase [Bdellovibrionota bacterium]